MSTIEEIAEALDARPNGAGFMAVCPAHDDSTPSLSINAGDDGTVLVHCHAGCDQEAVIAALRSRGLWPESNGLTIADFCRAKQLPEVLVKGAGWKDGTWKGRPYIHIPFKDASGKEIAVQSRHAMKGNERFKFRRGDNTKLLYGLERLREEALVLLVEGASDVLTAWHHGFSCVGVAGASAWDDKRFVPELENCDGIFAVIEPDQGGKKLLASLAQSKLRDKVRLITFDDAKDLSELHLLDPRKFKARVQSAMLNAQTLAGDDLVVRTLSDIEPKELQWLVPDLIPAAKMSIIAGDPGLGKSMLTLNLAAAITAGAKWPWTGAMQGDVLLLSAEDDAADTIRPRLDSAGADVRRVHIIEAVRDFDHDGEKITRSLSLIKDVDRIERALQHLKGRVVVIIIDPISAYLGDIDSHQNTQVRAAMFPLKELAARAGVAIIGVSHLTKGDSGTKAIYRVSGSLAFVAAVRAAFAVVVDPDDKDKRLFLPMKQNLSAQQAGFTYRVVGCADKTAKLQWEQGRVTADLEEAINTTGTKKARDDAVADWLTKKLGEGPQLAHMLWSESETLKFSHNRVKAVRKDLKVIVERIVQEDGRAAWWWRLPGVQADQRDEEPRSPVSEPPGPLGVLDPLDLLVPFDPTKETKETNKSKKTKGEEGRPVSPLSRKRPPLTAEQIAAINRETGGDEM